MGIVAKQAYANTVSIVIGIIAGAINTIIVLPHAFESSPEDWGLVRILLSYSIIVAQVFGLGTYNIIIREYNNQKEQVLKKAILGLALLSASVALLLLVFLSISFKKGFAVIIDADDLDLIYRNLIPLLVLAAVFVFNQIFTGFIVANHKTPMVQFVNEVYLKVSYLILATVYLLNPFSFDIYLKIFVGTYVSSLLIFVFYSVKIGFSFHFKLKLLKVRELLVYGGYTVLNKGAGIIVNNLDLIMIGLILNLADVAYYILAFYIGAVIIIPQRAIQAPAYPMVSSFINNNELEKLGKLYKQTSINQLIVGGVLFVLIWVNIEGIYSIIPDKFSGGMWVVFFIGISKLFILSTGVSGAIIIFSKYYRVNLVFNLFLILLTVTTNYFLIIKYGINGAAMATAITFLTYNVLKVVYIKWRFKISPFDVQTVKSLIVLILSVFLGRMISIIPEYPSLEIIIKSVIILLVLATGLYTLRVKAEILDLPKKVFKKYWKLD